MQRGCYRTVSPLSNQLPLRNDAKCSSELSIALVPLWCQVSLALSITNWHQGDLANIRVLGALGRIGVYNGVCSGWTGMGQLGAEAENKHQTAFCSSAMCCHSRAARARLCSCRRKGSWRLSPSLTSFIPTAPPCRAADGPSACSCRWAGPGDQHEGCVLHRGGGMY